MDCNKQLYIKISKKSTPGSLIALFFCGNIRLWPAVSCFLVPRAEQQTPKALQLDWLPLSWWGHAGFPTHTTWGALPFQILPRHLIECRFIPQDMFLSELGCAWGDVHSLLSVPLSLPTWASWWHGSARMPEVRHLALHPNRGLKTTFNWEHGKGRC